MKDWYTRVKLAPHFKSSWRPILQKNKELIERYRGGRCFIICTGPSIQTQNIAALEGQICITVSGFFLHPGFARLNPAFHVWNGMACHTGPDLYTLEDNLVSFRQMLEGVGETPVVTQIEDHDILAGAGLENGHRYYYAWRHWTRWERMPDVPLSLTGLLPHGTNGAIFALTWALGLGFREIYLLGVDNDYVLRFNGKAPAHFYKPDECAMERMGHSEWNFVPNLEKVMSDQHLILKHFRLLREYGQKHGQLIFNSTEGGLLDVYPRVRLEDAL
jgi:hypothetical protein